MRFSFAASRRAMGMNESFQSDFRHLRCTGSRSEEHTSELQSRLHLVCRLLLEKKKKKKVQRSEIDKKKTYTASQNDINIKHNLHYLSTISQPLNYYYNALQLVRQPKFTYNSKT